MSHALHHVEMAFVLLCTEPSGHGKTELVKPMGGVLSLPCLEINRIHLHHETDSFEAPAPCQGWTDGSRLNDFLTDWTGQKAVVFLDEFDKMNHE